MSPPTVSICVPTWNGERHLGEALASALAQTHSDFELLVVDDASTDLTLDVAAAVLDPRVRIERNARRLGIPGNWTRCLDLARGRYVKLLFQDDTLDPLALEKLVAALDALPAAPLAFSRREIRHEGERLETLPLRGQGYARTLEWFYSTFNGSTSGLDFVRAALRAGQDLAVNVVGEPSFVLLRKEAVGRAGGFDPRLSQLVDWDLWLRLARDAPLAFVDESLGTFRVHAGSFSAANHGSLRVQWEVLEVLAHVFRDYGKRLDEVERKRLASLRWRYRRHLVGEALRTVLRGTRDRRPPPAPGAA